MSVRVEVNLYARFEELGLTELYESESDAVLDELETHPFPEELGGVLDRIGAVGRDDRAAYWAEVERLAHERADQLGVEIELVDAPPSSSDETAATIRDYALGHAELPGGLGLRGDQLQADEIGKYGSKLAAEGRGYRARSDERAVA